MKRKFKKILSGALTLAMLTTTSLSTIPVNAAVQESYDIVNDEYVEMINSFGKNLEYEQEIISAYPYYSSISTLKHIYYASPSTEFNEVIYLMFEYENSKGERTFHKGRFHFKLLRPNVSKEADLHHNVDYESFLSEHPVSELNDFLLKNGYKAHFTEKISEDNGKKYFEITYDDKSAENVIKTALALNKEYGLGLYRYELALAYPFFADESKEETSPSVSIGAPTIAGDLDLNNEQGIADIVALTKYNTSAELFPITDATALANADINQDGTIDSIDTSLLIEIMLGTFESAV